MGSNFNCHRASKKIISVTNGIKVKQFNISTLLKIASKSHDGYIISDMENIQAFLTENHHIQFLVKTLKESNPRTKPQRCVNTIKDDISGLVERGTFEYVD